MSGSSGSPSAGAHSVNVTKQLLTEEVDIFSFAVSKTFDERLSRERSERFMPSRPCRSGPPPVSAASIAASARLKPTSKKPAPQTPSEKPTAEATPDSVGTEPKTAVAGEQIMPKAAPQTRPAKLVAPRPAPLPGTRTLAEKYKGGALEQIRDPHRLQLLSIEDSLLLGQEQKYREFELERQKFTRRLSWRNVTQFDSDSEPESDELSDAEDV